MLANARADHSYGKLMLELARSDLIILDDWGIASIARPRRQDLLEILEDRHFLKSTIVYQPAPVDAPVLRRYAPITGWLFSVGRVPG